MARFSRSAREELQSEAVYIGKLHVHRKTFVACQRPRQGQARTLDRQGRQAHQGASEFQHRRHPRALGPPPGGAAKADQQHAGRSAGREVAGIQAVRGERAGRRPGLGVRRPLFDRRGAAIGPEKHRSDDHEPERRQAPAERSAGRQGAARLGCARTDTRSDPGADSRTDARANTCTDA